HQGIWDKNEQQEKDWRQVLLENYPYVYSDELDRALIRFVDSSILESRIMLDHYEKFVLEKKRERAGQRLDRAWEHFHNSFGDKETEFGDELFTVIRDEM